MTIGTLVVFVPSFRAIDTWLGLEKWLPLFRSVLEMGSYSVAQGGLELMGTSGASRTLGGCDTAPPGLKWLHCKWVKQIAVCLHNRILPGPGKE